MINYSNTPSNLILMPTDSNLSVSCIDFSNSGYSSSKDSNAFKKIQKFSKFVNGYNNKPIANNRNNLKKIENVKRGGAS
jgi:hypothetical protein